MKKVSIVVPVYNQWDLVKRNIDALIKHDRDFIKEIIIVNDQSPELNPYYFDTDLVQIISNEKNLGYTGTVNNGLKRAISEIIVLLDSDAYPIGPFIQKLVHLYSVDNLIGCIGFSTVDDKGNSTGNYQFESSIIELVFGQVFEAKLSIFRSWCKKVKFPNSCAVSFRKQCLDELNYFDEVLFPVLDADVDICMRIYRSSWKLIFTQEIIISHKGGNSYKINYKRVLLHHESRWKLLKKYDKIKLLNLAKLSLKARVKAELLILKILSISKTSLNLDDKIIGRKKLLKQIDLYK